MVETFQSEISYQDLEIQIADFLSDGDFVEIERRSSGVINNGWTDYVAQVLYREKTPLLKLVAQLSRDYIENLNMN